MLKNPIPKGYEILTLCERGYKYAFLLTSRVESIAGVGPPAATPGVAGQLGLSRAVVKLCKTPPLSTYRFIQD